MAKSRYPDKEVLVVGISHDDADKINYLADRNGVSGGGYFLQLLEEAGVTGICTAGTKRAPSVLPRVRIQIPKSCLLTIKELSKDYPSLSAWVRKVLADAFQNLKERIPQTFTPYSGIRTSPGYHPVTGEPWRDPPWQGDSRWPYKYFVDTPPNFSQKGLTV